MVRRNISRRRQRHSCPHFQPINPRKYRIVSCSNTLCKDHAILNCWCDQIDNEIKLFHNQWIDLLESSDVTLEKIAKMDRQMVKTHCQSLWKKPAFDWFNIPDWSKFDFKEMAHRIAVMGKFIYLISKEKIKETPFQRLNRISNKK